MSAKQMVDRNGMRIGAGAQAVLLLIAFLIQAPVIVALVAVALGIGAIFGMRAFPFSIAYRWAKQAFKLRIPAEPEEAGPPRFAQTIGFGFLGAASAFLLSSSDSAAGWALTLIVAALQTLLAVTGICVGCEMFLLGRRIAAKGARA